MSVVCPDGHTSESDDYCDVCGLPISAQPVTPDASVTSTAVPVPPSAPTGEACPNCGAEAAPLALFCEECGYDFTTGALPQPPVEDSTVGGGEAGGGAPPAPLTPPVASGAPSATSSGGGGVPIAEWVAEVWIDPDWYATQASPCLLYTSPSPRDRS